jgi:ferredoxin
VDAVDVLDLTLRAFDTRLPEVDPGRCVATRYQASGCRRCTMVCPDTAIDPSPTLTVDPDRCRGCTACAVACPTGALGFSERQLAFLEATTAACQQPAQTLTVVCERVRPAAEEGVVLRIPCLGGLGGGDLIAAWSAGLRQLDLTSTECADCRSHVAVGDLAAALAATRDLLAAAGERLVVRRLVVADRGESSDHGGRLGADGGLTAPRGTGFSRRDLFGFLGGRLRSVGKATARRREMVSLHAVTTPPPAHGALVRHLQRLAQGRQGLTVPSDVFHVASIVVSPACDGCGLCVRYCPHGALALANGRSVADARLCTGCGLCAEVCPPNAVEMRPAELPLAGPSAAGSESCSSDPPGDRDAAMRAAARRLLERHRSPSVQAEELD